MQHMTTERRAAALGDRRHDLELAQAEMPALGLPPSRSVGAEDIRDLKERTRHAHDLFGRLDLQIFQWALHLA